MAQKRDSRRPPRPATWNSPKGTCRFCGEDIIENGVQNKRKNWHKECFPIWNIMSSPSDARRYLWKREQGVCQGCGKDTWKYGEGWETDHHKPLFESEGDLSFWHPDNLRLLCWDCHSGKTKEEATRRALTKKQKDIDQTHNE